ncbi:MAG: type II toxin-antitoxin system prevent-host-death family antitoxin [Geminicoccaceae bacterium]|nr:type II toxin-antitoxin system prevent-host-death family antitoxin [Geminicoccaceae bacterium]
MTITVEIDRGRVDLADLLARLKRGEEIVLAEDGKPLARMSPLRDSPSRRRFGSARGQIEIGEDFDEPLPEALLRGFGVRA